MENYETTEEGVKLPNVDEEEFEKPATAYGAKVKRDKEGNILSVVLAKDRELKFDKPGKRIGVKPIFTVKAIRPDGAVVQLPLEDQINNNIASPVDALGLRVYVRKGFIVLYDFATRQGLFCPAWDCWAKGDPSHGGYCSAYHQKLVTPEEAPSGFSVGATTTASVRRI